MYHGWSSRFGGFGAEGNHVHTPEKNRIGMSARSHREFHGKRVRVTRWSAQYEVSKLGFRPISLLGPRLLGLYGGPDCAHHPCDDGTGIRWNYDGGRRFVRWHYSFPLISAAYAFLNITQTTGVAWLAKNCPIAAQYRLINEPLTPGNFGFLPLSPY